MNILIINGSPKGDSSITLQTVNYLQKLFPDHTYDIIYAGQQIKSIHKRQAYRIINDAVIRHNVSKLFQSVSEADEYTYRRICKCEIEIKNTSFIFSHKFHFPFQPIYCYYTTSQPLNQVQFIIVNIM